MLSRHLYEIDEVKSALQYCCIEQKTVEACFWLQELIDSDEIEIAISGLVEVYLMKYGTARLEWFLQMFRMCNEPIYDVSVLNSLTCALCQLNKKDMDVSLLSLYLACTLDSKKLFPPEKLLSGGPDWLETAIGHLNPIEKFFARALINRKIRSAIWAMSSCRDDIIMYIINLCIPYMYEGLQICIKAILNLSDWSHLQYLPHTRYVICCMMIAIQHTEIASIFAPLNGPSHLILNKIQEWDMETGRVSRRRYKIPHDCLYASTKRGIQLRAINSESNLIKMGSNPMETYRVIYDCSYWIKLWTHCNGCLTDEDWELFCENAFPDDIPDEWSIEERSKSHGPGLVNAGEALFWRRWLRLWITPYSICAENKKYINNDHYLVTSAIEELVLCLPMEQLSVDGFIFRLINIIQNTIKIVGICDEEYLLPKNDEGLKAMINLSKSFSVFGM